MSTSDDTHEKAIRYYRRLYTAALLCGLAPLAIGTGIFVLWYLTRWNWLAFAWVFTFLGCVVSVIVGAVCLLFYALAAYRPVPREIFVRRVVIALAALLVNFPVAYLIVIAVTAIQFHSCVVVINEGPDIDRFVVSGACGDIDLGPTRLVKS
jgi:hypothetical protein